jgi:hypothetical protein
MKVSVIHDGLRYPCDQCDYAATRRGDLKQHKESQYKIHVTKLTCTIPKELKIHRESKHEDIWYSCDQCDNAALRSMEFT